MDLSNPAIQLILATAIATLISSVSTVLISVAGWINSAAARKLGNDNAAAIETVHKTINSNHATEIARATSAGHAEGMILERDQADARAAAAATPARVHAPGDVVAVRVEPGVLVRDAEPPQLG